MDKANLCIEKSPKFIKAYYRKSQALIAMGELKEARRLLANTQIQLGVKNLDFEEKIKTLSLLIKEQEFFQCIQKEDEMSKLKPENLAVEKNYQGPLIEEDTEITLDFIKEIISYLFDQKKIAKKYLWILIKRATEILDKENNVEFVNLSSD